MNYEVLNPKLGGLIQVLLLLAVCLLSGCENQVQKDTKLHKRFGPQALIYYMQNDGEALVVSSNRLFYIQMSSTDAANLFTCRDITDFLQIQFKKD